MDIPIYIDTLWIPDFLIHLEYYYYKLKHVKGWNNGCKLKPSQPPVTITIVDIKYFYGMNISTIKLNVCKVYWTQKGIGHPIMLT